MYSRLMLLLKSQMENKKVKRDYHALIPTLLEEGDYSRFFNEIDLIGQSTSPAKIFPEPFDVIYQDYRSLVKKSKKMTFSINDPEKSVNESSSIHHEISALIEKIAEIACNELLDEGGNIKIEIISTLGLAAFNKSIYAQQAVMQSIVVAYTANILLKFQIALHKELDIDTELNESQHYLLRLINKKYGIITRQYINDHPIVNDANAQQAHYFVIESLKKDTNLAIISNIATKDFSRCQQHKKIRAAKIKFWIYVLFECGVIHDQYSIFNMLFKIFQANFNVHSLKEDKLNVDDTDLSFLNEYYKRLYAYLIQYEFQLHSRSLTEKKFNSPELNRANHYTRKLERFIRLRDISTLNEDKLEKSSLSPSDKIVIFKLVLYAIRINDPTLVTSLINLGVNISNRNQSGKTVIQLAAQASHWDCVIALAKIKTDDNDTYKYGIALLLAAKANQSQVAETLLSLNASHTWHTLPNKNTALHYAAINNNPQLINKLLSAGANASTMNQKGKLAIGIASDMDHWACVKIFVTTNPDALNSKFAVFIHQLIIRKNTLQQVNNPANGLEMQRLDKIIVSAKKLLHFMDSSNLGTNDMTNELITKMKKRTASLIEIIPSRIGLFRNPIILEIHKIHKLLAPFEQLVEQKKPKRHLSAARKTMAFS